MLRGMKSPNASKLAVAIASTQAQIDKVNARMAILSGPCSRANIAARDEELENYRCQLRDLHLELARMQYVSSR